jgi:hypothetical protein
MTMSFPFAPFYFGETVSDPGYFQINGLSTAVGDLKLVGASSYDYAFSASVTVSACDLIQDNSIGGVANGDFAGGATLSVVGDLWAKSDPGTLLVDDAVILEGLMQLSSSETWTLLENTSRIIDGSVVFDPTDGGLNSGIAEGSDTLIIGTFRADFSFQNVQPIPGSFAGTDFSGIASTLQIVTIPEPCTILLLSIGGLVLRKRR